MDFIRSRYHFLSAHLGLRIVENVASRRHLMFSPPSPHVGSPLDTHPAASAPHLFCLVYCFYITNQISLVSYVFGRVGLKGMITLQRGWVGLDLAFTLLFPVKNIVIQQTSLEAAALLLESGTKYEQVVAASSMKSPGVSCVH